MSKTASFFAALTTSVPKKQYVAVYVFYGDGSKGMVPWGWVHVFLTMEYGRAHCDSLFELCKIICLYNRKILFTHVLVSTLS